MEHLTPRQEEGRDVKPEIQAGLAAAAITPELIEPIVPLFQEQASKPVPRIAGFPVFGGDSMPRSQSRL